MKQKNNYYQQRKASVYQEAVEYQIWASSQSLSYGELAFYNDYFHKLGKRYGLLREFRENCICY